MHSNPTRFSSVYGGHLQYRSVFSHLREHVLHLIALSLGTEVGADALLEELEGLLVLGDTEKLHRATLVGRESGDLANKLAHDLQKNVH